MTSPPDTPRGPDSSPRAFVVSTGSEIMAGLYPDRNAMELSRELVTTGFTVSGHTAAPDGELPIRTAIEFAAANAELVVITGGLGPTEDDRTRDAVAQYLGAPLVYSPRAEAMMRARFEAIGREMPERNTRQAWVPRGCSVLPNFWGTAPGVLAPRVASRPMIVAMPGVPAEWRPMFARALPRRILPAFPARAHRRFQMLHLAMIPESEVNQRLAGLYEADPLVEIGTLAQRGLIRVEIAATGPTEEVAEAALARALRAARDVLPRENLFAEGPGFISLEETVVGLLRQHGHTVALAESCTGGGIARRLTDIPGSSEVFREGAVTYSNEAKRLRLDVSEGTLREHGAVSEPCAREMARNMLKSSGADVALSVTGIAGPDGGTEEKPVGLVYFGLAARDGTETVLRRTLGRGRDHVRMLAELQGLDLLRRWCEGLGAETG